MPLALSHWGPPDWVYDVKLGISCAFDAIPANECFFTAGLLDAAVNPGLDIPDVGRIGLPVAPDIAQRIARACSLRQHAQGSGTSVNESEQTISQLDPAQFSLRNPKWHLQLRAILAQVVPSLGINIYPSEVSADLHKLLLHDKNSVSSLPHHGPEEIDGMFGTLVICLPSEHDGGDIIAQHKNSARKYSSSVNSEYGFSFAAWCSDARHEVRPVTSGHRLVLVYKLIHHGWARTLQLQKLLDERLRLSLLRWQHWCEQHTETFKTAELPVVSWFSRAEKEGWPPILVHVLDYEYPDSEPSWDGLTLADQERMDKLKEACNTCGLDIFCANLEKRVYGKIAFPYDDESDLSASFHEMGPVIEKSYYLSNVIDTHGKEVIRELKIPRSVLLDHWHAFADEPDDEYCDEREPKVTHFYRRGCILLLPREFQVAFWLHAVDHEGVCTTAFFYDFRNRVNKNPRDNNVLQQLLDICRHISYIEPSSDIGVQLREDAGALAFQHREWDTFCRCLGELSVFHELGDKFGKEIARHGLIQACLPSEYILEPVWVVWNTVWWYSRECESPVLEESNAIFKWAWRTLQMLFDRILSRPGLDRQTAAELVQFFSHAADIYLTKHKLSLRIEREDVLKSKLSRSEDVDPQYLLQFIYDYPAASNIFIGLIEQYHGLGNNVDEVLDAIQAAVSASPEQEASDTFTVFSRPFIESLCCHLGTQSETLDVFSRPLIANLFCHLETESESVNSPANKDQAVKLIMNLLEAYLVKYVQRAPQPPATWQQSLPASSVCPCDDCKSLKTFVEHPDLQRWEFSMGKQRREHLVNQLDDTFLHETIRPRSPYTLVVTKTLMGHDAAVSRWQQRARSAKAAITALKKSCPLVEIIGEETYNGLLEHENFKAPPTPTLPTTAPEAVSSENTVSNMQPLPGHPGSFNQTQMYQGHPFALFGAQPGAFGHMVAYQMTSQSHPIPLAEPLRNLRDGYAHAPGSSQPSVPPPTAQPPLSQRPPNQPIPGAALPTGSSVPKKRTFVDLTDG
ncbi:hypothetical protein BJX61DRAFT_543396 [Aspergillus egyptiacus]|nr:hypothetical protein BJX61DRAFT_543396 [Aspergillus egyptiacus]